MRVIHLASYGGTYAGSFIAMIRAVAAECAGRGWTCEAVFAPVAGDRAWYPELAAEMPVRTAPEGAGRRELADFVSGILDESAEPTLLHTHFTAFDLAAVAASRRHAHARVMWHLHTRLESGAPAAARNALKFAIAGRGVEQILCAGPEVAAAARRRLARRVTMLPNAIDGRRFTAATDAERQHARRQLHLPADRPVLAHFGWDWEMKGGDLFVAAARELAGRGTDVVALSVGASSTGDGLVVR